MEYTIPVSWSVYDTIYIEADSLEKAITKAREDDSIPLGSDPQYLEGSWDVDEELAKMMDDSMQDEEGMEKTT